MLLTPSQPLLANQTTTTFFSLKVKLLVVLQTVTYNRADGIDHVVGVIQAETAYKADHNSVLFPIPKRLGLWDDKFVKDAMVVEMKNAKAIYKACAKDYGIWKAAKDGSKKLIRAAVEEVYINELKDGTTFFHKVFARDLLELLEKNATGLHALDIVALRTKMLLLYKNAASMPDFILTVEEAQKKAKRDKLPLDIELAMYAATSVLQSGDYKKETNEWEGCDAHKKTVPSGNRPTWPRTPRASTASMSGLQMNCSPERPTTSCPLPWST